MGKKSAFWVDGKAGRGTRRRLKTKQGKAEDVLWGDKGRRGIREQGHSGVFVLL